MDTKIIFQFGESGDTLTNSTNNANLINSVDSAIDGEIKNTSSNIVIIL